MSTKIVSSPCISPLTKRQQNELVLINHSWISPTLQIKLGLDFFLLFKKMRGKFLPQKRRGYYEKLRFLLIFVFVNPRNFTV